MTPGPGGPASAPPGWKRWWPVARRVLALAFAALVLTLLFIQAREVHWGEVFSLIADYPGRSLFSAAALAASSYGVYCCFELLARRYTGHRLPKVSVFGVAFVSYAFALSLGSLIGGAGLRFRLYSRLGLDLATVTRIWMFCVFTNWLGYMVIAGTLFSAGLIVPPGDWDVGASALRLLGGALLAVAALYVAACGLSRRRSWTVRGQTLTLPSFGLAVSQCVLSILNWLLIASVVFVLLQQKIGYELVLGTLLMSAIAGTVAHVPAGLGVTEAVFVALLGHLMPRSEMLAALLVYRALYYLGPLVIAAVVYLGIEMRARALRDGEASAGSRAAVTR